MSLDLGTVGFTTAPHKLEYDWRTLATYALGVGATVEELPYLYERTDGGMRVLPSFAVIPAHAPILEALLKTGGDLAMIVHGGQIVRAYKPITQEGTLETVGSIKAIYDLRKFAQVILETQTRAAGEVVYETVWSIIFRGAGNFGGARPPQEEAAPTMPKDRAPDFVFEQKTTREQALLYRISGDQNPLHADPVFATNVGFPQGPILHGLCTFGFLTRAVVKHACAGDPNRLRTIAAQFRRPVWPGDTLVVSGTDVGDGRIALATTVKERDEAVLGGAHAVIG
ncbi:MAG: MaoC/PaaZ C-terminal domain-containing protein [Polyangiaceae bacterium]